MALKAYCLIGDRFLPFYRTKENNHYIVMERKVITVVAAIIQDSGRYLVTQRGSGQFENLWEFPGGKVEEGESHETALAREIQEELAIVIHVGELFSQTHFKYPSFDLNMSCYICAIAKGNLVLKEHKASQWLLPELFDLIDFLPADVEVANKIRALNS